MPVRHMIFCSQSTGALRRKSAMQVRLGTAFLLATGFLVACNDPKAANKENFQKALSAFFDKNCILIAQGTDTFPIQTQIGRPGSTSIEQLLQSDTTAKLNRLVDAGLLTRTSTTATGVTRFDLTSKGHDLYRPAGASEPFSPSGFCAGHAHVVSVDGFTNPTEENGRRMSQVIFTMRPELDEWTKAPAVQAAFPGLPRGNSESGTLPVVLMSDGWTVGTGRL